MCNQFLSFLNDSHCVYVYIYIYFKLNTIVLCSQSKVEEIKSDDTRFSTVISSRRYKSFESLSNQFVAPSITILFSIIYENSVGVPRRRKTRRAPFHSIKNARAYQFLFKRETGVRKYNIRLMASIHLAR